MPGWFVTILVLNSIAGKVLLVVKQPIAAMIVWAIGDFFLAIHNFQIGQYQQAFLFMFFVVSNSYGILNWLGWEKKGD